MASNYGDIWLFVGENPLNFLNNFYIGEYIMIKEFTSESVSEGHPDKISDQISDAVLDAALKQDPSARVAVETFVTTNFVLIGGEVSGNFTLDYEAIARKTIKEIGYVDEEDGFDASSCEVLVKVHEQSKDIAQGVNEDDGLFKGLGAGDQGIMFGYACNQTPSLMPLPIILSHRILQELAKKRKEGVSFLKPDSKAQVSVEYFNKKPVRVSTVVVSTQHSASISHDELTNYVIENVIKSVISSDLLKDTKYLINPTGRFVVGGPHGDAGLTGRKIIVDTYGGWSRHGGGAFSGKDSTKVDRSASYMARYVAKNIVAAGLADEVEVQLSYAIGFPEPISILIDTFGTETCDVSFIYEVVNSLFDFTPSGIIKALDLRRPIFQQTAAYGHFGRLDVDLPWERTDKVDDIKALEKKKLIYS